MEEVEEEASIGVGSRTVGRFRVRLFWGSKHACPKLRSLLVPGAPRFNKKSIRRYGGRCMRSPGDKHRQLDGFLICLRGQITLETYGGDFRPKVPPELRHFLRTSFECTSERHVQSPSGFIPIGHRILVLR